MATLQERRLGYHSRAGLEPGTSRFSNLRLNHYAARGILDTAQSRDHRNPSQTEAEAAKRKHQDECLTPFYLSLTQSILPFTQLVLQLVVCVLHSDGVVPCLAQSGHILIHGDYSIAESTNRRGAHFGRIAYREAMLSDAARFGQPCF